MKICPVEAEVFHANGWQIEADICNQHHTQERAPVPTVRRIGGPV